MPIVIKNGRVIDPASQTDRVADVLIVDGRIAGVAPNLASPKAEIFDATGMIVAPGFIDMHEGAQSVRWGLRGIPAASEDVMVARDLVLAQLTGARYHVAHISTRNAVGMVAHARRSGLPVSCEATPHHFSLSDDRMPAYDSNYKMKPPLRSACDRGLIIDGIAAGTISAIATDHAPHPGSEKMQEFERCPFGIIGLETAIALALEELVAPGKITLNRMIELFTTGPESVVRLGRGTLTPGGPGDVTVFSTEVSWTYDVNQSHSRSRNTPFHGRTFRGGPMATVVNGEFAWRR